LQVDLTEAGVGGQTPPQAGNEKNEYYSKGDEEKCDKEEGNDQPDGGDGSPLTGGSCASGCAKGEENDESDDAQAG